MNYNEFMEIVKSRKSVRAFKADPVPEDLIHKIVHAAKFAPSGNNTQPIEIVAVNDAALIHEMESKMGENFIPPFVQRSKAPAMLVVLGDPRFRDVYPKGNGVRDAIYHASLCLAVENMFLAITTLGLGSVWKHVSPLAGVRIKELLDIPQMLDVEVVLPLGFPKEVEAEPKPKRDIPIHINGYDSRNFKSDEEAQSLMKKYCRSVELGMFRML